MPAGFSRSFRFAMGALASVLAFTTVAPSNLSLVARARAQAPGPAQQQIDFDAALEGYGHWAEHPKLGDVWIPDNVPQDWQPYRIGHWVYTDDWGWYWNSDEDFGWVTYHYGRWYLDRQLGWVWAPSDEWGPAWVNWRQGDNFVGWAPTPPDEYLDDNEEADNYMFVEAGNLLAPEVYTVFIPYRERRHYYDRSRLVNRTIIFADRRGAVNPGIPPAFIAHAGGRPFHYSHVAPIVLAGTIGVAGAVILRDHYRDRARTRVVVRRTDRTIRPGDKFERLPGLNKGERGRLWNKDLRAAQGGKAILHFNAQDKQRHRYIRTKGDAQRTERKKIEEKRIDSKRIEQKNFQRKEFEQKNIQQHNLQPQNTQQKNLQQKSDEVRRGRDEDRKRSDDRRNIDRKDLRWNDTQKKNVEQRSIQQKNIQQNNQTQKNPGSDRSNRMQKHEQQRNLQQNTQRQHIQQQQHSGPKPQPQNTQRQQNNRKGDKDKKNN